MDYFEGMTAQVKADLRDKAVDPQVSSKKGGNVKNVGSHLVGDKDKIIGVICEDQEGLEYGVYFPLIDELVDKFLTWPLPDSVCADLCATKQGNPHRSGTNLLTAIEAKQMLEYLLQR